MASPLPILIQEPPQTPPHEPTYPVDDEGDPIFDTNALSPLSGNFTRTSNYQGRTDSPRAPPSARLSPHKTMMNGSENDSMSLSGSEKFKNPFNFQPMQYTVGKPPVLSSPAAKQTVCFPQLQDTYTN
jgi:hypothetical protein